MKQCDRVIIFDAGKIVAEGTYETVSKDSKFKSLINPNE
jgi:ABC-type branched-subunit amino acid transport system ATPase component